MSIEIKREKIGKFVLPPVCVDEFGNPCKNNGKVCECNVYSGNPEFPLMFQGK